VPDSGGWVRQLVLELFDNSENGQNTIFNAGNILVVSGTNMTGLAKRLGKMDSLSEKGTLKMNV
jgi:hypothetical protein